MSEDGPPIGPDGKPDLRFSEHEGRQVKVSRDLSGGGHLARGDHTRMSRLNFSARARPADPGERDVSAFGGRAPAPESDAAEPAEPAEPTAAAQAPPGPADDPGLLARVTRLLGL